DLIRNHDLYRPTLILILLGAFAKSAQFPFHFWLPHAMAAPTPVSAYLHSATMVKAGIFLLGRLYPALSGTPEWFGLVSGIGLITLLFVFGKPLSVVVAIFHILNHACFKAALFMNAGIVDHETGTMSIRDLGGLWKMMPFSGGMALVAGASMAGFPPLNGFLSKEMFLEESLHLAEMDKWRSEEHTSE